MTELEAVRKAIRDKMNTLADYLADGSCNSWDDYRHNVGVIRGLAEAEAFIIAAESRVDEDED